MPSSSSTSAAHFIVGQSERLPMMMPIFAWPAMRCAHPRGKRALKEERRTVDNTRAPTRRAQLSQSIGSASAKDTLTPPVQGNVLLAKPNCQLLTLLAMHNMLVRNCPPSDSPKGPG